MSVAKIFKVLIVIVACVIIGAIVLNVLLPNATTALVNAVEGQIYNATGMSFDFNGDTIAGSGAAASAKSGGTVAGAGASTTNNGKQNVSQSGEVNGFNSGNANANGSN